MLSHGSRLRLRDGGGGVGGGGGGDGGNVDEFKAGRRATDVLLVRKGFLSRPPMR